MPFSDAWLTERLQGARNAVRHAGLPDHTLRLYPSHPLPDAYDRLVSTSAVHALAQGAFATGWNAVWPEGVGPFGIVAPNDDTAYAVLEAAREQGQSAGRDFGLVGFDDDPLACTVGLTTVRPPVEAMGEEAGRLLLRALQGDKKGQLVRLRSHLIARASTRSMNGSPAAFAPPSFAG
jgi:DNA-binding LacI/PurR family transcriptional regulator